MKRNVYKFVVSPYAGSDGNSFNLQLNGRSIGSCWTDSEKWRKPYDKNRSLVFWYTRKHTGFAYSVEDAKNIMLACAKQEVERERRSRYRK